MATTANAIAQRKYDANSDGTISAENRFALHQAEVDAKIAEILAKFDLGFTTERHEYRDQQRPAERQIQERGLVGPPVISPHPTLPRWGRGGRLG